MAQAGDNDDKLQGVDGQDGQPTPSDGGAGGTVEGADISSQQAGAGGEPGGSGDDLESRDLTPEEREILREHRREERKQRKERQRQASVQKDRYIASLEGRVRDLVTRVESVESRSTNADMARLNNAIESAAQEMELAKSAKVEARKANNPEIEAEAEDALYNARRKHEELSLLQRRIVDGQQQRQQQRQTGTASAPDPTVVENASNWKSRNSWYDPLGRDEDSRRVRQIDLQMTRERWDPRTPEYWDELTDRVRQQLPQRFQGNRAGRQITGGGAGESGGGGNGSGFRLSAERIQALKEANMWDDPKQRAKMIKRYQDSDREMAEQANSR